MGSGFIFPPASFSPLPTSSHHLSSASLGTPSSGPKHPPTPSGNPQSPAPINPASSPPPPDPPPDDNHLPHPLPPQLQCKRAVKDWRCSFPILIGGEGMCTKHVSKPIFHGITGRHRGKIKEGKAQTMVEEKCSRLGGFFVANSQDNPSQVILETQLVGQIFAADCAQARRNTNLDVLEAPHAEDLTANGQTPSVRLNVQEVLEVPSDSDFRPISTSTHGVCSNTKMDLCAGSIDRTKQGVRHIAVQNFQQPEVQSIIDVSHEVRDVLGTMNSGGKANVTSAAIQEGATHIPSYCEALRRNNAAHQRPAPADINVSPNACSSKDGEPAFILTPLEFEDSVKACKWHAVVRFPWLAPHIARVKEIINVEWGLGAPNIVGKLNARHILVIAYSEEDYVRILNKDASNMMKLIIRIFPWSPNFLSQRETLIVPRWIRLPGLPTNLFAPSCLERIGDTISKFIKADEKSLSKENPNYGRICIEIDLSKELPARVWIGTSVENGFWQKIVIEGRIDYCTHCGIHGHTRNICKKATLDPNATPLEKVAIRTYCARCRMNNHSTESCRWKQNMKDKLVEEFFCSHCKKKSHSTDDCWTLKRQRRKLGDSTVVSDVALETSAANVRDVLEHNMCGVATVPLPGNSVQGTDCVAPPLTAMNSSEFAKCDNPLAFLTMQTDNSMLNVPGHTYGVMASMESAPISTRIPLTGNATSEHVVGNADSTVHVNSTHRRHHLNTMELTGSLGGNASSQHRVIETSNQYEAGIQDSTTDVMGASMVSNLGSTRVTLPLTGNATSEHVAGNSDSTGQVNSTSSPAGLQFRPPFSAPFIQQIVPYEMMEPLEARADSPPQRKLYRKPFLCELFANIESVSGDGAGLRQMQLSTQPSDAVETTFAVVKGAN